MIYDILTPEGEYIATLNKHLVEKQQLDAASVERLKELHVQKYRLFKKMEQTDDVNTLRSLHKQLVENNSQLQVVWRFAVDSNWYKFWEEPGCLCPKLDNNDAYSSGYYLVNGSCPIHSSIEHL
jgi:hypothetical protein